MRTLAALRKQRNADIPALREMGLSIPAIAKELGLGLATVSRALQRESN